MSEQITQLASGLTIATDRVPAARSVAIGVWVAVGSRDEPAELSGVSHFLEHLLFKGTPTRSATDISRVVDRVGGDINAFTSKEYTAYYCRMPTRHGATGIELLGDVLTRSLITDDDVESERQVILEELAMDDDSPDDVALRTLTRQLFGDHGLGRDTAGERATVRAITAADVREFFAAHYRTGATTVAVAGDVDHDEVVAAVDAGVRRRCRPATAASPGRRPARPRPTSTIDDDSEQVHLAIGGRSVPRDDPDREALDVVNHVFGGGLSSRLFDEIRERRGLAYSVYSATSAYADAGAWSVYAGAMPEHAGEVARLVGSRARPPRRRRHQRRRAGDRHRLPHRRLRDGPRGHRRPDVPPRRDAGHARPGHPGRRAARPLGGRHPRRRAPRDRPGLRRRPARHRVGRPRLRSLMMPSSFGRARSQLADRSG